MKKHLPPNKHKHATKCKRATVWIKLDDLCLMYGPGKLGTTHLLGDLSVWGVEPTHDKKNVWVELKEVRRRQK